MSGSTMWRAACVRVSLSIRLRRRMRSGRPMAGPSCSIRAARDTSIFTASPPAAQARKTFLRRQSRKVPNGLFPGWQVPAVLHQWQSEDRLRSLDPAGPAKRSGRGRQRGLLPRTGPAADGGAGLDRRRRVRNRRSASALGNGIGTTYPPTASASSPPRHTRALPGP